MAIKKELLILSICLILASTFVSAQIAKGIGTTVTTQDPCAFVQNLPCEKVRSDAADNPALCQMKCQGGMCDAASVPSINPGLAGLVSRCPGLNSRMCYVCRRTQQTAIPVPQTTQVLLPQRTQTQVLAPQTPQPLAQPRVQPPQVSPKPPVLPSPPTTPQASEFALSCRRFFNFFESREECTRECEHGDCKGVDVSPRIRQSGTVIVDKEGTFIEGESATSSLTDLGKILCWKCFPRPQTRHPVTQVTPPRTSVLEEISEPTVSQELLISPARQTASAQDAFREAILKRLEQRMLSRTNAQVQTMPPTSKPQPSTLSVTGPRIRETQSFVRIPPPSQTPRDSVLARESVLDELESQKATRVSTPRTTMQRFYPPAHTSVIPSRQYGLRGTPASTQPANACGRHGLYKDVLQCNSFCKFPSRCVSKQVPGAACFVCSRATSTGGGGLGIMAG